MTERNTYLPYPIRIETVVDEAPMVKTFRLKFVNEADAERFAFRTGQFGEYSVFGEGECTFCVASPHTRKGYIECTFRETGRVTRALAMSGPGDILGFRGPYGNYFPIDEWKGKNLLFIAGGIALPPLRSVIWTCLDRREEFREITVLYGAKTVADLVYKQELAAWEARPDMKLITCVDPGGDTPDWKGKIGLVPTVLREAHPSHENAIAILCGPPIMIKFTLVELIGLGFTAERIYTTLENRMKCGCGKCGRCNVGSVFVCKDGPVFTFKQIGDLPPEY